MRRSLLVLIPLLCAAAPAVDRSLVAVGNDIPADVERPQAGFDYSKRDVMIPMRDGVKLHTVIVVPLGARGAPILLTRTPYNAGKRVSRSDSPIDAGDIAAGRRRDSSPAATSASSRTCAANTARRATTR